MDRKTILVVDDVSENIDILVGVLGADYNISTAKTGEIALEITKKINPDLVLLDVMMPGMDGYQVCARLKSNEQTKNIPVIFLTALTQQEDEERGLMIGGVDYITKPFDPALLKARIKTHLELKSHRDNLEHLVEEKVKEIRRSRDAILASMAFLAEFRDPETGAHVLRTKEFVKVLAEELKYIYPEELTDEKIEADYQAAELHDVGKVGVPDSILLKPGKLTDEEFEEMKKHTIYGAEIMSRAEHLIGEPTPFLTAAKEIAGNHHEKWDGTGYPRGLKAEEIPVSARLMTVADIYDALRSKRPYKDGFTHEETVDMILNGDSGGRIKPDHFDPNVLQAFKDVHHKFEEIYDKIKDED